MHLVFGGRLIAGLEEHHRHSLLAYPDLAAIRIGPEDLRNHPSCIDGLVRVSFWGFYIGLSLVVILDLFPAGVIQLWDVLTNGYWYARRLTFLMDGAFHTLEWIRVFADAIFMVVGAVPKVIAIVRGAMMVSGRAGPHQPGVALPP